MIYMILMILHGLSDPLLTLGQRQKIVISGPRLAKIFITVVWKKFLRHFDSTLSLH